MKLWLTKFRISAAQDSGRPMPESLRQKIDADPELARFARRTEALGEALHTPPRSEPSLHEDIMQTLRTRREQTRREPARHAPPSSWLTPAIGMMAVAAFGFWLTQSRSPQPARPQFEGPAYVLEMSRTMPAAVPDVVMAPLSTEWARVNHDVRDTTQILLACFP